MVIQIPLLFLKVVITRMMWSFCITQMRKTTMRKMVMRKLMMERLILMNTMTRKMIMMIIYLLHLKDSRKLLLYKKDILMFVRHVLSFEKDESVSSDGSRKLLSNWRFSIYISLTSNFYYSFLGSALNW